MAGQKYPVAKKAERPQPRPEPVAARNWVPVALGSGGVVALGVVVLIGWYVLQPSPPMGTPPAPSAEKLAAAAPAPVPAPPAPTVAVTPAPAVTVPASAREPQEAPLALEPEPPPAPVAQPVLTRKQVERSVDAPPALPARKEPAPPAPARAAAMAEKKVVALDPQQIKVNQAISRGVAYLKSSSWQHPQHTVGYVALGGLTLLECGVAPSDDAIVRASQIVRSAAPTETYTYHLALAILFLDRLGDPADRAVIQGLALRLLAGQTGNGGWSYHCPNLPPSDMVSLFKFLESNRPTALRKLHEERRLKSPLLQTPLVSASAVKADPFRKLGELSAKTTKAADSEVAAKAKPMKLAALPAHLRSIPVVTLQGQGRPALVASMDDNSNTQFALMALWVARRHEVPTEQALLLSQLRFKNSQQADGHWNYRPVGPKATPAMTAVGLLGLAMGNGAQAEIGVDMRQVKGAENDPAVQKGFAFLSEFIGMPDPMTGGMPGLYFLWSVERVGVLYDQKLIGGKDWYAWGSQLLVAGQQPAGSWQGGMYHGTSPHVDTCLALLFLRRANLVRDLTETLRFNDPTRRDYPATSPR